MKINSIIFLIIIPLFLIGCQRKNDSQIYWDVYKGDKASTSYSALNQINHTNVNQLAISWVHEFKDVPTGMSFGKYECNPIVIGERMYLTSSRSHLYALNACNGKEIWSFDPFEGARGGGMKRGVAYWQEGSEERILFTAKNYLYAIDAKTGIPIPDFGNSGKVDLNKGLGVNPDSVWVIPTSPGIVFQDVLILGSEVSESYDAAPGHIRAFDVRTGEMEWIFHTIPQPGEAGYETWPKDAWKYTGGANNWGGMSLDEARGIVFIPLGSPTYDFYGANRKGKNLYGNCIVALDANTGKLIWYFQTIHHDIWDYDLPAPPSLVTLKKDGKKIDAVTLTTKTGFLFVFDRETGESLFPIEERTVPPSSVVGEEIWPTQPFPLKPEPYTRQNLTEADLSNVDPETHGALVKRFRELRHEGLFTPPDPQGTLMVPGTRGGSEWGGSAIDPSSGVLYINANESPELMTLQPETSEVKQGGQNLYTRGAKNYLTHCAICHGGNRKGQAPNFPSLLDLSNRMSEEEVLTIVKSGAGRMPPNPGLSKNQQAALIAYLFEEEDNREENLTRSPAAPSDSSADYRNITAYSFFRDPEGYPAIKPPWGTLNAIDLQTGEYLWKIPLGNYPERQKAGAPETGTENWGGPIVTAGGLVFIAATRDNKFRAFDKKTGKLLWETTLPGGGYATPATYMLDGRQYLVIAVSGTPQQPGGSVMAFSLPGIEE